VLTDSVMVNTESGVLLRHRRFESLLNTRSSQSVEETRKVAVKDGGVEETTKNDDGWVSAIISWIRIVTCFVSMMVTTFIWALIMVVLIPWPYERIRQGNIYGHVTGRMLVS